MKQNHPKEKSIVFFWLFIFILLAAALIDTFILRHHMDIENTLQNEQTELIELGQQLASASDYLTREARAFVVTTNPDHLRNYWNEVEITQQRDKAVTRLKELHATPEEVDLLARSKEHSDDLIHTEVHAMKLVLSAHEVPEDLMPKSAKEFELSTQNQVLSPSEKILLAQQLLYGSDYQKAKRQIMAPINTLRTELMERITSEIQKAEHLVQMGLRLLISLLVFSLISVIAIVWIRISILLDTPAK